MAAWGVPLSAVDRYRALHPRESSFADVNAERTVNSTWEAAKSAVFASALLTAYLLYTQTSEGWWIALAFGFNGLLLYGLYQLGYYLVARYLFWVISCSAIAVLVATYGLDCFAIFVGPPLWLLSLVLFDRLSERVTFTTLSVLAIIAALVYAEVYGTSIPEEAKPLARVLFVVAPTYVCYDVIGDLFRLNRNYRKRSRKLVERLRDRTEHLESERALAAEQEAALSEANAALERRLANGTTVARQLRGSTEQLEQFAYAASHDLKEPLRSISSFVQLIERRLGDRADGELGEYVGFVTESAGGMTTLLDGLLAYSRASRPAEPESVEVARAALLARHDLVGEIGAAGAEVAIAEEIGRAYVAKANLRTCIGELLRNALRFRREGARPRVTVGPLATPAGSVGFVVEDDGIGIPEEYRGRVFSLFERLHTSDQFPGAGIGLALVRKLVSQAGGSIALSAGADGGGTRVEVVLPRADDDEDDEAAAAAKPLRP